MIYKTFEEYWTANWKPLTSGGVSLGALDLAFKEVAEKAWNAGVASQFQWSSGNLGGFDQD